MSIFAYLVSFFDGLSGDEMAAVLGSVLAVPSGIFAIIAFRMRHRLNKKELQLSEEKQKSEAAMKEKDLELRLLEFDREHVSSEVDNAISLLKAGAQSAVVEVFRHIVLNLEDAIKRAEQLLKSIRTEIAELNALLMELIKEGRADEAKLSEVKGKIASLEADYRTLETKTIPDYEKEIRSAELLATKMEDGLWNPDLVLVHIEKIENNLGSIRSDRVRDYARQRLLQSKAQFERGERALRSKLSEARSLEAEEKEQMAMRAQREDPT